MISNGYVPNMCGGFGRSFEVYLSLNVMWPRSLLLSALHIWLCIEQHMNVCVYIINIHIHDVFLVVHTHTHDYIFTYLQPSTTITFCQHRCFAFISFFFLTDTPIYPPVGFLFFQHPHSSFVLYFSRRRFKKKHSHIRE